MEVFMMQELPHTAPEPDSMAITHPLELIFGAIMKILVRNLSRETTEAELLALFKEYGSVQYCKVVMDRATGKSKGFAFVDMPLAGEAKVAIKMLNAKDLGGSKIRVKKAETSEEGAVGTDSRE
jgi:RNA recognition motif-containing protein